MWLYICLAGCQFRDIGILVDTSGSIVEAEAIQLMKRFVMRIIGRVDIGPSENLVGLVQFSESVITVFTFDTYAGDSKARIFMAIEAMPSLDQNTNTAFGLRSLCICNIE